MRLVVFLFDVAAVALPVMARAHRCGPAMPPTQRELVPMQLRVDDVVVDRLPPAGEVVFAADQVSVVLPEELVSFAVPR